MTNNVFFSRKSCPFSDNVEKYGTDRQTDRQDTDDSIIRRMRTACWITEATDTHSEFVMLTANRREQWLRERTSVLRYTYSACLADSAFFRKYLDLRIDLWVGQVACMGET